MRTLQPVTFYVPPSSAEPIEVGVAHSGLRMVLVGREAVYALGQEWAVLGVYFLLGPSDDPDRYRAYVGEVGRRTLLLRLKEHASQKEWWSRALLIASASDVFNSAEIGWLEGRLYDVLNNALAADVQNRGRPGDDSIAERDRGVLERYVEPIMAALRACGASPDTADQKPVPRGRRKVTRYTESVKDLLDANLLKVGTRLQPLRRGLTATALVCESGELEVNGQRFAAVSPAAIAVTGAKAEAGWDFWGAPSGEGGYVPLARLRERLRQQAGASAPAGSPAAPPQTPRPPTAESARSAVSAATSKPPNAAKPKKRRRADDGEHRARYAVAITDLIGAGLLMPGERLTARLKGQTYETTLLADGRARGIDGHPDQSISMVAARAIGRNVNGWDFWTVEREGRAVRLAAVRAQLLASAGGDSPSS